MIQFGIPEREVINKEKYPEIPVLKMELVQDKGFNRRFSLNQNALEVLNVIPGNSKVIFAFDDTENKAYIAKHSTEDSVLVGKNKAFSNKRYYEYICKMKDLNSSIDNYFELTNPKTIGDITIYELVQLSTDSEVSDSHNKTILGAANNMEDYEETEEVNVEETVADFEPHGDRW